MNVTPTPLASPATDGKRRLRVIGELPGPKSRALRSAELEHLAPGTQAIWEYAGIAVDSGIGSELIDVDGNRFLDLVAGISVAALGYAHPRYIAEFGAQLAKIHVGSFTTEARLKALKLLAEWLPRELDKVQFFSGGSEAVESALRLARAHTGKFEVLSFWGGFHGKTSGALAQMGSDFKHGLGPLAPGALLTPYADCARCPFKLKHPSCGLLCVEFAREKLKKESTGRLAAILVEPMQGTAGNVVPPPDFLPAIEQLAREHEALLIADEMITGFARTGRRFGIDHTGVKPDIMTLGKGMGAGYPVTAVATRAEIARAEPWSKPSFSSSSYGGNPLAAAAVASSLGIIGDEHLIERARIVGSRLKSGLWAIADRHPTVANVRGEGFFLGFDLIKPGTEEPWSSAECRKLFDATLRRGVVTMAYAPRVRINPPLILSEAEADEALAVLDESLSEVEASHAVSTRA
ncbi:MAG TPA: aspartate aminotransferase family protein [Polyangiaceae bacterium]|nr:aspartate aminotransferase family protein [Polyangiaceae bacterium]